MGLLKEDRQSIDQDYDAFYRQYHDSTLMFAIHLIKDRDLANDLTQEAFSQICIDQKNLAMIEFPKAFMKGVVSNLYRTQIKEASKLDHIEDFDSIRLALVEFKLSKHAAVAGVDLISIQGDLINICRYVCRRKARSIIGSIFILKFFYEYTSIEIEKIIDKPSTAIDNYILTVRNELRANRHDLSKLRFISKNNNHLPEFKYKPDNNLIIQIIDFIFLCCSGKCLSKEQLSKFDRRVIKNNKIEITKCELAHIVSCLKCLSSVLSILKLPLLPVLDTSSNQLNQYAQTINEKMNNDNDKRDDDDINGPGSGGIDDDIEQSLIACRRRVFHIKDHRPTVLSIYIDDLLISKLNTVSEYNTLEMRVPMLGDGAFIHVRSETGLRMSMIDITSSESEIINRKIKLTEDRTLEIQFNTLSKWLHVCYENPLVALGQNLCDEVEEVKWADRITSWIYNRWTSQESSAEFKQKFSFSQFYNKALNLLPQRFVFATAAIIFILLIAISSLLFKTSMPTVTASEVEAKASEAEKLMIIKQSTNNKVLHRTINILEKQLYGDKKLNYRLEQWIYNQEHEIKRVYEVNSKVSFADESKYPDGRSEINRNGVRSSGNDIYISPGDMWRVGLTIHAFKLMTKNSDSVNLQISPNFYILTKNVSVLGAGMRIVKATITLRKDNYHPVEQVLLVQIYGESQLREYRFKETKIEFVPITPKASKTINSDSKFIERIKPNNTSLTTTEALEKSNSILNKKYTDGEIGDLQVEILYHLDLKRGNTEDETIVIFSADGSILVDSVVATNRRKEEILSALKFASNHPKVRIDIKSVEDVLPSNKMYKLNSIRTSAPAKTENKVINQTTLDDYLNIYFSNQLKIRDEEKISQEKAQYLINISKLADSLYIESWGVLRVTNGFTQTHLKSLSPNARLKWVTMVNNHLREYYKRINELEIKLEPILRHNGKVEYKNEMLSFIDITDAKLLHQVTDQLRKASYDLFIQAKQLRSLNESDRQIISFAPHITKAKQVVKTLQSAFKQ